jgi:hypothetical protein
MVQRREVLGGVIRGVQALLFEPSHGRPEVLCHSGGRWAVRLLARLGLRLLLTFAYSWLGPAAGARANCERALDALLARPVWWRTRARTLVAELLSSPAG